MNLPLKTRELKLKGLSDVSLEIKNNLILKPKQTYITKNSNRKQLQEAKTRNRKINAWSSRNKSWRFYWRIKTDNLPFGRNNRRSFRCLHCWKSLMESGNAPHVEKQVNTRTKWKAPLINIMGISLNIVTTFVYTSKQETNYKITFIIFTLNSRRHKSLVNTSSKICSIKKKGERLFKYVLVGLIRR